MPPNGTLKDQGEYIFDQMAEAHPEIEWGCDVVKKTTLEWSDVTYMC
jgi:hypothetical protein